MTAPTTTNDTAAPATIVKTANILINDLTTALAALDHIEDVEGDIAAHARSAQVPATIASRYAMQVADSAGSAAGRIRHALEDIRNCRAHLNRLGDVIEESRNGKL